MIHLDALSLCLLQLTFFWTLITGAVEPLRAPSSPYSQRNDTAQLYSEWSKWSSCSSSCGLGIITRTRSCLKRVYNSRGAFVPLCHAEYSEHRICNLRPCPPDAPHPRSIQCAHHNNRTVAGKLVREWVPVDGGRNPCELRCKDADPGGVEYGFGKVSSGTPCPQGVCLDGRCLRVGCDDRLGSEVVFDKCGVCGGRNAGCVHYKDVFMGQPPADSERRSGYHEVVVLPVGARNLIIHHLVGKNYLALQDRTRGIIFNGEQHLTQYGGHYNIAGTSVQFEKSDTTTEILTAQGPVTEELYVLVLLRGFNQGIYYEYWLPKHSHSPTQNQYPNQLPTTSTTTTLHPKWYSTLKPQNVYTKPAYQYKPLLRENAATYKQFTTTSTEPPRELKSGPLAESYVALRSGARRSVGSYKQSNPLYNPRAYKPSGGYYQTFRNVSASKDSQKVIDLDKERPVLTQPDLSGQDNVIPNTVLDEKELEFKPYKSSKEFNKRGGEVAKNYVTNGRLKYSIDGKADEVYVNSSKKYTPSPLAIALLPDNGASTKGKKSEGGRHRKKPRFTRGGACTPCERSRDQTKHFCSSDFVIRGLVIGFEFIHGETRYEIDVKQTFKNTLSLLPKEFVWSPDTSCRCPRLRPGKEYVIMGRIDNNYRKRESRLLVDRTCFVRTFNLKYARRLQKLKKDRAKKCLKTS